jgi:hypothetical protein
MGDRELTLADLLTDPMTLAMMAADRVDPAELKTTWTALARRLAIAREAERRPVRAGCDQIIAGNSPKIAAAAPARREPSKESTE